MHRITKEDINRLIDDPIGFATMMDNYQLELAIVAFVSVLMKRKPIRGDKN